MFLYAVGCLQSTNFFLGCSMMTGSFLGNCNNATWYPQLTLQNHLLLHQKVPFYWSIQIMTSMEPVYLFYKKKLLQKLHRQLTPIQIFHPCLHRRVKGFFFSLRFGIMICMLFILLNVDVDFCMNESLTFHIFIQMHFFYENKINKNVFREHGNKLDNIRTKTSAFFGPNLR